LCRNKFGSRASFASVTLVMADDVKFEFAMHVGFGESENCGAFMQM